MEYISIITENWSEIGGAVLAILGGFSVLAKFTPTDVDNKIIDGIFKFVHVFGLTKK